MSRGTSPAGPPPVPSSPRPGGPQGRDRWTPGWNAVAIAAAGVVYAIALSIQASAGRVDEVDYAEFLGRVRAGEVASVVLHQDSGAIEATAPDDAVFTVQGPPGGIPDADLAVLDEHGVERSYAPERSDWLGSLIGLLLPVALLAAVIVWLSRRTQRQISGATSFARSKARVHTTRRPGVTLADVAGYETAKQEITEVIDFLRNPDRFRALGARAPKGMLLVGPPGTGKTLFARAIAGEARVPFISITGSEFLEMFVGVGAARVRDLFETARKKAPCIVFVDEIDAIGRKRGVGLGGGHDEREQALNQLLAEMDGFEAAEGIIVLAATNRPDILDPALLRAGRFDRQVVLPLPTQAERVQILEVHVRNKPLAPDVDLEVVARGTPGMSGADLANLVNEAALMAARRGGSSITMADVDAARDRILMGLQRPSMALSDEERRIIAHHEAGHAVLAELLEHADPVHKVTILPTGRALGATQQLPERERHVHRRAELDDILAVRLAGRAAEEVVFGTASSGGHDDLVNATELARKMVREWGMSERLGHLAWGSRGPVFLGEDLVHTRDYSDQTAHVIDEETERLLAAQADRARAVLGAHRAALEAVADALLERETLSGDEVATLISGASLHRTAGAAESPVAVEVG